MNLLRKPLKRLRALLPKLRIVWDYSEVDAILRDRDWQMAGPVQKMLGPLLGEGVIMATGKAHTDLRRQLGPMPHPDLSAIVDAFEPTHGLSDIGADMMRLAEDVMGAVLGAPGALRGVGAIVRRCVALAPFRLLGLPLDRWALRKLDKVLAGLPVPPWLVGQELTAKQLRDWRASFVVAGLDTLAADLTAQLVGVKLLPIYWLPRTNVATGELAIVLLSEGHKFGGGFRRCAGLLSLLSSFSGRVVFDSNLDSDKLRAHPDMGARIVSRLFADRGGAACEVLTLSGADQRQHLLRSKAR
jgi:hypothetical protein